MWCLLWGRLLGGAVKAPSAPKQKKPAPPHLQLYLVSTAAMQQWMWNLVESSFWQNPIANMCDCCISACFPILTFWWRRSPVKLSHLISDKRFEDKKLRKVDKFYFGDHLMPWLFLVYFIDQSLEWRRRHTYPIAYSIPSHCSFAENYITSSMNEFWSGHLNLYQLEMWL